MDNDLRLRLQALLAEWYEMIPVIARIEWPSATTIHRACIRDLEEVLDQSPDVAPASQVKPTDSQKAFLKGGSLHAPPQGPI